MKLLTYGDPAEYAIGLHTDAGVLDLGAASIELGLARPLTARSVFSRGLEALDDVRSAANHAAGRPSMILAESGLKLGPAVPYPAKIFCIGLDYRRHAVETGYDIPTVPIVFSKFANTLAATGDAVVLPRVSSRMDYEVELAVVIGSRVRDISPEEAHAAVIGYATANDVSARDLQTQTSQWLLGKTLAGFLPIGPYVVTSDEITDPGRLAIRTWVNGEVRQDSNTSDMIFNTSFLVSYLSRHLTLDPGDVVLTGTPSGVIAGMKDPIWLRDGDVVAMEVAGLGRLENRFEAEV